MLILIIGLVILFLDQLTKQAIRAHLVYGESIPVIDGFFNLVYVRNDGAAWNLLAGHGIVLILISFSVMVALYLFRDKIVEGKKRNEVLMGLLFGGIAGNLIDRIRFGWVTDFLDFEFGSYHYPSFNVADSAICIVFVVYLIFSFIDKKNDEEAATEDRG
ncbi:signal peptidase II [Pontiella sp.]|uniref:signal peptidase II n=1 Tax=Pontiella sp. TaxID=2837462 RepID=UPI003564D8C2